MRFCLRRCRWRHLGSFSRGSSGIAFRKRRRRTVHDRRTIKWRGCLQFFLGRGNHDDPFAILVRKRDAVEIHRHILFSNTQEPADADHQRFGTASRIDDHVIDVPNRLALFVGTGVDRFADDRRGENLLWRRSEITDRSGLGGIGGDRTIIRRGLLGKDARSEHRNESGRSQECTVHFNLLQKFQYRGAGGMCRPDGDLKEERQCEGVCSTGNRRHA